MQKQSILTITMIVRNEEKHMSAAIQSLLCQTYSDFKLVIVNNGSKDSTGAIADGFSEQDHRVEVLHLEENDPFITYQMIERTQTPYYMFAAGHDFYAPAFIEKCLAALESNPLVVLAYPRAAWFKDDKIIGEIPGIFDTRKMDSISRAIVVSYGLIEAYQFYGIYRLAPFKSLNKYPVIGADHVLLTELALSGSFALIDETLFFLRMAENWGDWEVYRKKLIPDETDNITAFVQMTNAYMSIAERIANPHERVLLKMAFFTMSLLRHKGTLGMFGESITSLFSRPGFQELSKAIADTVSIIEHEIQSQSIVESSPSQQLVAQPSTVPPAPAKPNVKIAGEGETGKDLTKIQEGSSFENALRFLVISVRPRSIIETGTYLGTGTTRIIASALRDAGLTETRFFTIECNPIHHHHAVNNLAQSGLSAFVKPLLGLSVPRSVLPDMEKIQEETVTNIEGDNIFVDHQEANRVSFYYRETDFPDIQEDLLGNCLNKLEGRPSIVLLDSAGHLGNVEFNYLIGKLKGECYVVLDDVCHIKHHKSLQQIKHDPRFTLITSSDEKFGFCIAKFNPGGTGLTLEPRKILFVRTDSIGDTVLAMSMIPQIKSHHPDASITVLCQGHIAELYETCPYCDDIITFDRRRLLFEETYRLEMQDKLQQGGYDLCLNSVYSRELVNDFLVLASSAQIRIGHTGDLSNMLPQDLESNNRGYSHLIPSEGDYKSELERHRDFLRGIGIDAEKLGPRLWLTDDDYSFADRTLNDAGFDPEKTIVMFAGVQVWIRRYERYGEVLRDICREHGFSVIALGAKSDFAMNQANLDALDARVCNLSGAASLRQSAAIISRCRLAMGAETGLAHIACAVGTPNVILLGGGHFGRFMPYSQLTSIACLPLECYGCNWQCRYSRPHCITDINPQVFRRAIADTLASLADKPRMFVECYDSYSRGTEMPGWGMFNRLVPLKDVEIIPVDGNA